MTGALKPVQCLKCQGGGLIHPTHVLPGRLIEVCGHCMGTGELKAGPPQSVYRAAWCVGTRFLVRLAVELPLRDVHELHTDWHPFYPPKQGKGRLKVQEKRDHQAGITAALQQLKEISGARGDFTVMTADERH